MPKTAVHIALLTMVATALVACSSSPPTPTPTPTPIPCPSMEEQGYFDALDQHSEQIFELAADLGFLYGMATADQSLLTSRAWQADTIELETQRLALFQAYLDIPAPNSALQLRLRLRELVAATETAVTARIDSLRHPGVIDKLVYDERALNQAATALINYEGTRESWCW